MMTAVLAFKFSFSLSRICGPLTLPPGVGVQRDKKKTAAGGVPPNHTVLLSAAQTRRAQPFQRLLRHLPIALVGKPLRRFV